MDLPLLNSYADIKMQKAYERYVCGESQAKIVKALKVAPRTLARRCKVDGWEAERQARKAANLAAAAAVPTTPILPNKAAPESPLPELETRSALMERMLREWQDTVALLRGWIGDEVRSVFRDAAAAGKRPAIQKVMQLANMTNSVATLDKKVHCVPDKIETKDTTPTPEDKARKLTDEQLDRQLAEAEGATASAAQREAPTQSVN